jgi:hypothetical protein
MKKLEVNNELIGKYINRVLWSDVDPVGKIIGVKGKTKVIIQPVKAGENKVKMEFIAGGFSAHCINQSFQEYDFLEKGEPFIVSLSNSSLNKRFWRINEYPRKWYDYNF